MAAYLPSPLKPGQTAVAGPGMRRSQRRRRVVDIGGRRKASNPDAQGARSRVIGQAEGAQHVGRLDGRRRACGTGGDAELRRAGHQVGGGGGRKRQVQVAGDAGIHAAIHRDAGDVPAQAVQQPGTKGGDAGGFFRHLALRQAGRLSQADDQRRGQGAGAQPALLPAAGEQRREADPWAAAHEQGADALGAVDLVAGDGGEIDMPTGQIQRDFSHRLGDVGVEQGAGVLGDGGERGNVLYHTDLVVHRHDADQQRGCGQGVAQGGRIQQAVGANWQEDGGKTLVGQVGDRFQHTLMLGGDGDDAAALVAHADGEAGRALDGDVVALGGTGGEHDLLHVGADQRGDLPSRVLHCRFGVVAHRVLDAVRVAVAFGEERQHGVQHARVAARGRLVVQVDGAVGAERLVVHGGNVGLGDGGCQGGLSETGDRWQAGADRGSFWFSQRFSNGPSEAPRSKNHWFGGAQGDRSGTRSW